MRTKKIVICIVFLSIFFMLSQSINATSIINKEIKNDEIKNMKNNIALANENIKKILSLNSIESLHDIVMMIWEIISIFIGHNVISMALTRLCCCWFVFPIVVLNNIFNINVSGGGLLNLIKEYFSEFDFEYFYYTFGALCIFILPIVYIVISISCLIYILTDGIHVEGGILDGIRKDLEYIYTPDYNLGNFKPDNNNKSNYTFIQYIKSLDTKNYFYHTGILGLSISPMLIFLSLIKFTNLVRPAD